MREKIGMGIVTYNRPHLLEKLYETIGDSVGGIVIVNDGTPISNKLLCDEWIDNPTNIGVGRSKNKCLRYLLSQGYDYIFIAEDDVYIKDPEVFEKYIEASKKTGIQHFNFSQHGVMNKEGFTNSGSPNPRKVIDYGDIRVPLFPHCVGAFSFYTRKCLEQVGLIDEAFFNAAEHVDHTYKIIKEGMHPPFWFFADIENSNEYIGDEPWTIQSSTISSRVDHKKLMEDADKIFVNNHGTVPCGIPDTPEAELQKQLIAIRKKYGPNASNL